MPSANLRRSLALDRIVADVTVFYPHDEDLDVLFVGGVNLRRGVTTVFARPAFQIAVSEDVDRSSLGISRIHVAPVEEPEPAFRNDSLDGGHFDFLRRCAGFHAAVGDSDSKAPDRDAEDHGASHDSFSILEIDHHNETKVCLQPA